MRMDDDELLTLKTCLGDQVLFLEHHPEIDLVAFCTLTVNAPLSCHDLALSY